MSIFFEESNRIHSVSSWIIRKVEITFQKSRKQYVTLCLSWVFTLLERAARCGIRIASLFFFAVLFSVRKEGEAS